MMLHTDSFSLLKNARKIGANERNYAINKVDQLFRSPQVKQALDLRELYGYYGHGLREKLGQLHVPEVAVIQVDGKSVVLNAAPSNVCVELSINKDTGVVTHTEEILKETDGGKIISAMMKSKVGGWSWATGGSEGAVCIPTVIKGFDYVNTPNFISIYHPASKGMMLESSGAGGRQYSEQGAMFLESMQAAGYGQEAIDSIIDDMQKRVVDLDLISHYREQAMILEAVAETRALELVRQQTETVKQLQEMRDLEHKRSAMFLEAVESLPVFIGAAHRNAIKNMTNADDFKIIKDLFESVSNLPHGRLPNIGEAAVEDVGAKALTPISAPIVSFTPQEPRRFG